MAFRARQSHPLAGTARVESVGGVFEEERKHFETLPAARGIVYHNTNTARFRSVQTSRKTSCTVPRHQSEWYTFFFANGLLLLFFKVVVGLHKERKPTRRRMLRSADVGNGDNYAD